VGDKRPLKIKRFLDCSRTGGRHRTSLSDLSVSSKKGNRDGNRAPRGVFPLYFAFNLTRASNRSVRGLEINPRARTPVGAPHASRPEGHPAERRSDSSSTDRQGPLGFGPSWTNADLSPCARGSCWPSVVGAVGGRTKNAPASTLS